MNVDGNVTSLSAADNSSSVASDANSSNITSCEVKSDLSPRTAAASCMSSNELMVALVETLSGISQTYDDIQDNLKK